MDCSMPGFPVLHRLPELAQIHAYWVGDTIQPSHPLLSPSPSAFNLSQHRVFSSESDLPIRWPEYQSFSFSISPSSEYSGLISFRMDWLDLLHRFYNVSWLNWSRIPSESDMNYASFRFHAGSVAFTVSCSGGRCSGLDCPWQLHSGIWRLGGDSGKTGLSWDKSTRVPRGLLLHSQTSYREARSSQSVPRNLKWVQAVS